MKNIIIISLLSWVFYCCHSKGFTQAYITTIKVVDLDNKPLKNVEIQATKSGVNSTNSTKKTDFNGEVQFDYSLEISESYSENITIEAKEDSLRWVLNTLFHGVENSKAKNTIKQTMVIQMDSSINIKIRLKKTSQTPYSLSFHARISGSTNDFKSIKKDRTFMTFRRDSVALFDSLFVFRSPMKEPFTIYSNVFKPSNTAISDVISFKNINITSSIHRDSVLLIEL